MGSGLGPHHTRVPSGRARGRVPHRPVVSTSGAVAGGGRTGEGRDVGVEEQNYLVGGTGGWRCLLRRGIPRMASGSPKPRSACVTRDQGRAWGRRLWASQLRHPNTTSLEASWENHAVE